MRATREVIEDILRNQNDVRTASSNYRTAIAGTGVLALATLGGLVVTYGFGVLARDSLVEAIKHFGDSQVSSAVLYSVKTAAAGACTALSGIGTTKFASLTLENITSIPVVHRQCKEQMNKNQMLIREYDAVTERRSVA